MSPKVAILGANGFIGSRAVELFHLGGLADVRPVVRSLNALARLSRFDLDCRVADCHDQEGLRAALAGCEAVIHSIAGDPSAICSSVTPVYRAAQAAGVRRLVYLSSASVHGQAPPPGTDEKTPLSDRQPIAYNNAKVWAERQLSRLRAAGAMELAILRPGIVTGPRSNWQFRFAADLLAGTAYWLDDGRGICNSLYVDNLIHALHLALTAPGADGQAFLVGDQETVTWADLYRPIADALGFDPAQLPNVDYIPRRRSWRELARAVESSMPGRTVASLIPKRVRRAVRVAMAPAPPPGVSPWTCQLSPAQLIPQATLEMSLLYRCAWKLPDSKARKVLGYRPSVTFAEGCRRTVGWLDFAGFPTIYGRNRNR